MHKKWWNHVGIITHVLTFSPTSGPLRRRRGRPFSFSERGALLYNNIRAKEEHDPLPHFFSGMHIRCHSILRNCNDRITHRTVHQHWRTARTPAGLVVRAARTPKIEGIRECVNPGQNTWKLMRWFLNEGLPALVVYFRRLVPRASTTFHYNKQ